jgi:hypothetical protein
MNGTKGGGKRREEKGGEKTCDLPTKYNSICSLQQRHHRNMLLRTY